MSRNLSDEMRITSGSYIGNNTENRAIKHRLGKKPKLVMGSREGSALCHKILQSGKIEYISSTWSTSLNVNEANFENFYVGNSSSYWASLNANNGKFYWVAIG